jgi:hypothetical protein
VLAGADAVRCGDPNIDRGTGSTASRIAWKPLLTLTVVQTRCDGKRFASFTADRPSGSSCGSTVILGSKVLQPGQTRATALRSTRQQAWRIIQATEPQTIKAVVRVTPSRCPYGIPTTNVSYGTVHFN